MAKPTFNMPTATSNTILSFRRSTAVATSLTLVAALSASAAEYNCSVNRKVDYDREYSADHIKRFQFTNRIEEKGEGVWVSRCSFDSSASKVTCNRHKIDRVVIDPHVQIKKFYVFSSQFDLQLYPDLSYVENNGRGSISYGKCVLNAP
jgi:hypothetical protein